MSTLCFLNTKSNGGPWQHELSLHFLRSKSMVQLQQETLGVSIHDPEVPAFHTPATHIPSFQCLLFL